MKLDKFTAGHWRQRYQYKSFEPTPIDCEWTWDDPAIAVLLERATLALGELNAFSLIIPDIDLFIRMHVVKEATTSSRIEGTQTGIDEVLLPEEQIPPEKRDDWREVHNYIDAMGDAVEKLANLPLSNRLIRATHAVLMRGVRGERKTPGEFRVSQNWIGGSNLTDAVFIPPHPDSVPALMGDLETFMHNDGVLVPHLIRIAICHYQFETIHPFLDGNGRIGRLMIPLYLISHGLLAKPSLYLSDFFARNRASYYDALMHVRTSNSLAQWVKFFLSGLIETAQKGCDVFRKILKLRTQIDREILTVGRRAPSVSEAMNLLYSKPIVAYTDVEKHLGVSHTSANAIIKALRDRNILVEITGGKRWRNYAFNDYLELFIGDPGDYLRLLALHEGEADKND